MKYAVLFAAAAAFLATAVRAEENIAVEEAAQEALQDSLAQAILAGQDYKGRDCCNYKPDHDRKHECISHCRCKPGQILLGRLVEENGRSRQVWKCVEAEANCKVKCRAWDGFAGFCLSDKQESRPKCHFPEELFAALPQVLRLPVAKAANAQEQLFELFSRFYLTFDKNGFGYIEETRPLENCGQCCNGHAACLRRIEFEPATLCDYED